LLCLSMGILRMAPSFSTKDSKRMANIKVKATIYKARINLCLSTIIIRNFKHTFSILYLNYIQSWCMSMQGMLNLSFNRRFLMTKEIE
jgi:hypothetical protein